MSKSERRSFEISETWFDVSARCGGQCEVVVEGERCKKPMTQLGHIVPQDEMHTKIYGEEILHHSDNLVGVCTLYHNGLVELDVKTQPMKVAEHIARLRAKIEEEHDETH